jgi:glycosyltransferase involved in cell wall biosynthesis
MHQELATVAGSKMLRHHKVLFDFEDWYSEDLLAEARKSRPLDLLKKAEKIALHNGALCTTTSNAMANALAIAYNTASPPRVIYNSFDPVKAILHDQAGHDKIRLYWFSQTIGEGRGLEFFIGAMGKSSAPWELYLRGNITHAFRAHLARLVSRKDKLIILPVLGNDEILSSMNDYDIGLALEPGMPPNKDLTISNKFFHYLAAGLPIIASSTKGHAEIGERHPEFIFIYEQNEEDQLVALLNHLAAKSDEIKSARLKESILKTYQSLYAWELEEQKLIHVITQSFENISHTAN